MKRMGMLAVVFSTVILAGPAIAEEGNPGQRRGEGLRARAGGGQGQARIGEMDPEQMVARMMQQFDQDGDQKLDSKELLAMMKTMRERRGGMMRGDRAAGQGPQRRIGAGRRGAGEAQSAPGGQRPRRPQTDQ